MGTITINIDDSIEADFRKKVYSIYGRKKGVLGRAVTEAIIEWDKKKKYLDNCMKLLESGVNLGRLKYKNRGELHDRN